MAGALKYLIDARPEEIGAYFKFLKGAGKHLDPKTRDLISVITKVDVKTENGLKQYLSRALRNGATPNEVIDALLMAFPTLGLAKIVWAIDIILELDIPEFSIEALHGQEAWHDLGPVADFADRQATYLKVGYRSLFVYRNGDRVKAYDSTCPHQVTNIPELAICENHLTCPKHEWKFDLETGECIEKGTHPLKSFEVRIRDGVAQAWW